MIRRATIIVSGIVQEAGYREEVAEKAFDLFLKGCVRNRDDGNVEIICEGEQSAIRELARKIRFREYPVEVETVRCRYSEPTGEFRRFTVIKDTRLDSDYSAKLEGGFHIIKAMRRDLAGAIRGVGSEVRGVSAEVRGVRSDVRGVSAEVRGVSADVRDVGAGLKAVESNTRSISSGIRSMDQNIGRRFDRLDRSYGSFGKTLDSVSRDMKGMKSSMSSVASDTRALRRAVTAGRSKRNNYTTK